MAKLIIYVDGRLYVHGHHRLDFKYNPTYETYIHNDRVYDEEEFNAVAPKAIANAIRHRLPVAVKIVEFSPKAEVKAPEAPVAPPPAPAAPVILQTPPPMPAPQVSVPPQVVATPTPVAPRPAPRRSFFGRTTAVDAT